jgi:hypothetical protein
LIVIVQAVAQDASLFAAVTHAIWQFAIEHSQALLGAGTIAVRWIQNRQRERKRRRIGF